MEIGPHHIATHQWITHCWDLVIKTLANEHLEAPTLFELFGKKVHAWWIHSPKTCLTCKMVDHLSSSPLCPQKKKKSPSVHPAVAAVESGVSSRLATAATTLGQRQWNKSQRLSKATTLVEVPTGDFTIESPLPPPTT